MSRILTSIHGRKLGLSNQNGLVITGNAISTTNKARGKQYEIGNFRVVEVTSAQLLALNATPQTIVDAPGAGYVVMPRSFMIHKPAGTAYAGIAANEDLVFKYTNASGAEISGRIASAGFLDQATAQSRAVGLEGSTGTATGDFTPVANAAVVIHLLTGEITTGTSPLYVHVLYDVLPLLTS